MRSGAARGGRKPGTPGRSPLERSACLLALADPEHVATVVEEDVGEGVPDLCRRAEHVRVVPVREHRAVPTHHAVQRLREANLQALHALGEGAVVVRLGVSALVASRPWWLTPARSPVGLRPAFLRAPPWVDGFARPRLS
jgi:hypothetical protein